MAESEENVQKESSAPLEPEKNIFLVKERYEIDFNIPLPQFDTNGAVAFQTKDKTNPQKELFALVCSNEHPPRLSVLSYLKSIDHTGILKLVDYGVVDFPQTKTQNMALIYRQPTGPKVSLFNPENTLNKNSFEKFKSCILSLLSACEALKSYNLTHRALRPDNLYYKDSSCSEIVIGDCAASFPSLYQPSEYETIENLLALPQGRGNGIPADDAYAIGVVMLAIVLQKEINLGVSTPELLRMKLKKGSYVTLTNGEKIASQFTTVLKGLLVDNAENRWSYMQVYNYLEGKGGSVNELNEKSMRALTINGEKLYTSKSIAIALQKSPEEAIALIRSGKLQEWIKNGLGNEKLYARIIKIAQQQAESNSSALNMVSQICILLDHTLPIKTGDLYLFPEGLPKAIFYYLKNGLGLTDFYSLLSNDLIKLWYQEQPSLRAPSNSSEFKNYINRKDFGYGIDRIMYDFDEDLPCTSPLINGDFINSPSRLLRSLNNNYSQFKERIPYDKNIIAYLRCKMGKKIDGILTDLNSRQESMQNSAIIRLYANIQNKHGPVHLYKLTQWLLNAARPVIRTYHNLKYQKYLEHELIKTSKSGKIIDLYDVLENEKARQKDKEEFSAALKEINRLTSEKNKILSGSTKLDEESKELAWRFAAVLGTLSMITSFVFSLLHWIMQ